ELLTAYVNETDYTVWVEIAIGLASLRNLLFEQRFYPQFEKFCQKMFSKIGQSVGWKPKNNESHTQGLLRNLILSQQISYNDPAALKKGREIFTKGGKIPADIRSVAYQAVAHNGGKVDHTKFEKKYISESLSEEKNRVGRAMAQFQDQAL